ncbi:DUF3846 domain-containing protein [Actinomadura rudentiformis]|nr:DUF3846 domain-containing protein [Actinomadura rudentiformis]
MSAQQSDWIEMNRTALVLAPTGLLQELPFSPQDQTSDQVIHEINAAIGCTVSAVVRLTDTLEMWLDEEGIRRQPVNVYATLLARRYGFVHQDYRGVALLATVDPHGVPLGLEPSQTAALRSQLLSLPVIPPIHSPS